LLGGGVDGNGSGRVASKVLKVPSKRGLDVLAQLLDDYQANSSAGELFNEYFDRNGEKYFYDLLKPLTDLSNLQAEDYIDWGQEEKFSTAIGVGECAGVLIDLVSTLFLEAEEKLALAWDSFENKAFADSLYFSYSARIHTAKALLLDQGVSCNTQAGILGDFDKHFAPETLGHENGVGFQEETLQINQQEPSESFGFQYFSRSAEILEKARVYRQTKNN